MMRWSLTFVLFLLFFPPLSSASEYVGLWKVDSKGDGVALSFPDNGFAGACVKFSGSSGNPGHVRVESQVVRHRFNSFAAVVDAVIDPANVHVQATVKGKTVWAAVDYKISNQPILVELNGHEIALEAKKLAPAEDEWSVSLCGIEFSNDRFSLRFTSDCAGFDLEEKDGSITIMADEDWYSLGWEMSGGLGVFGLEKGLFTDSKAPISLSLSSFFPGQLFYAALARNNKPLVELREGEEVKYDLDPRLGGEVQFVVKSKTSVKGMPQWKASVSWHVHPIGADPSPEALSELVSSPDLGSRSDRDDAVAVESRSRRSGTGCSHGGGASFWLTILIVPGLMILRRVSSRV